MNELQKYKSQVPSIFKAGHGYLVAAALTAGLALQCLDPDFASKCQDLIEYVSDSRVVSRNADVVKYERNTVENNDTEEQKDIRKETYKPEEVKGFGNMCDIQNGRIVRFKIRELPDKF